MSLCCRFALNKRPSRVREREGDDRATPDGGGPFFLTAEKLPRKFHDTQRRNLPPPAPWHEYSAAEQSRAELKQNSRSYSAFVSPHSQRRHPSSPGPEFPHLQAALYSGSTMPAYAMFPWPSPLFCALRVESALVSSR